MVVEHWQESIDAVAQEMRRPSAIYRPELRAESDRWVACYGNKQEVSCVGFGATPEEAMADFDYNWRNMPPHYHAAGG